MNTPKQFTLDFSNRVIEHLGIKLYQNKPTNVVAEYLSNAWDADAKNVDIDIKAGVGSKSIIITDNGRGMTREELTDHFLVIGRNRRNQPDEKSQGGRGLMGRKGIGKLAGFGIANTLEVLSIPNPTIREDAAAKMYWLRFSLTDITKNHGTGGSYHPEVIADGADLGELDALIVKNGGGESFASFVANAKAGKGGVCIRLNDITIKRELKTEMLLSALGRRFTVTMTKADFVVRVNATEVSPKIAFPAFQEFKIGDQNAPIKDSISINGKQRDISYWVRFVNLEDQDWPIENAGIGIYSHGKIAQDRPFFFDVKGKEIHSRYMYGVIEADWLDELPDDVVSTDRRSIDWSTDDTEAFHNWGAAKIPAWLDGYRKWRESLPRTEIKKKIRTLNQNLSAQEEDALADLLSEVFTDLGNNEDAKNKTTEKITSAWTHAPTRKLTQSIWKEVFAKGDRSSKDFGNLMEQLRKSMVPESMGLAVTMAQRIHAITSLHRMIVEEKTETHLQRLIEKFPWLLDPEHEFLTANQSIRTLAEEKYKSTTHVGAELLDADGKRRPDFVFLSDPGQQLEFVIYELKGPECGKTLQPDEFDQLQDYIRIVSRLYPDKEVRGILVGHDYGGVKKESDTRIRVRRWADVLQQARHSHVSYLEALLRIAEPEADDTRLKQIADFGGKETLELLKRYQENEVLPKEI